MAELLFKVGDSGGYKDGQVIAVKPDGWLIGKTDMAKWIDNGIEPAEISQMPEYLQFRLQRRINKVRWMLSHSLLDIAAEYDTNQDAAQHEKDIAQLDADGFKVDGLDTNWGREDLKVHCVVWVDGFSEHDCLNLVDSEQDTDHKAIEKAKRRWRVDYQNVFTAQELVKIWDERTRVDVNRVVAISDNLVKKTEASVIAS